MCRLCYIVCDDNIQSGTMDISTTVMCVGFWPMAEWRLAFGRFDWWKMLSCLRRIGLSAAGACAKYLVDVGMITSALLAAGH